MQSTARSPWSPSGRVHRGNGITALSSSPLLKTSRSEGGPGLAAARCLLPRCIAVREPSEPPRSGPLPRRPRGEHPPPPPFLTPSRAQAPEAAVRRRSPSIPCSGAGKVQTFLNCVQKHRTTTPLPPSEPDPNKTGPWPSGQPHRSVPARRGFDPQHRAALFRFSTSPHSRAHLSQTREATSAPTPSTVAPRGQGPHARDWG